MKKLLVVLVAMLCCSATTFAQNKGDMYFGGYAGVSIQAAGAEGDSAVGAAFGIQPEFGYFVANRLKIGASLGYGISAGTHTFTLTPNISYYLPLCDGLYYTPGLEFGFALGAEDGFSMPGIGLAAHFFTLEFRPSEHFGFSANLLSLNFVSLTKYGITANVASFDIGVNPTIGFKYYF
jgi:hypothetical protein